MAVFSRQDHSPGRTTKSVGDKGVLKPHTFRCQPVNVWSLYQVAAITAHRLLRMIVSEDDNDIRLWRSLFCWSAGDDCDCKEEYEQLHFLHPTVSPSVNHLHSSRVVRHPKQLHVEILFHS